MDCPTPRQGRASRLERMNIALILIIVIAVVLLLLGGILEAVRFLLWVGIALIIIAVIMWALRSISGKRR